MKKQEKITISVIIIIMTIIQYCFPLLQSLANETVDVNVVPCPVVDIVVAKSTAKVEVTNFEKDVKIYEKKNK